MSYVANNKKKAFFFICRTVRESFRNKRKKKSFIFSHFNDMQTFIVCAPKAVLDVTTKKKVNEFALTSEFSPQRLSPLKVFDSSFFTFSSLWAHACFLFLKNFTLDKITEGIFSWFFQEFHHFHDPSGGNCQVIRRF